MGNTKVLYIHIGTHKTGTSAIQNALRQEKNKLKKEGIVSLGRPKHYWEIGKAAKIVENYIQTGYQELSSRIKRESFFKRDKFIVSAEHFSGDETAGYRNSKVVAEILKRMTDSLNLEKKIIIYLRRQDEFIQSLYTQQIHEGETMGFREFVNKFDQDDYNWQRVINDYEKFFGKENLIVKRYSKIDLPNNKSIIHSFGSEIGSKTLQNYESNNTSNPGFSRDALEIARILNSSLDTNESRNLRKILQRVSFKKTFERYSFFDSKQRIQFMNRYDDSNSYVAKRYFDRPILFSQPDENAPISDYKGLTSEAMVSEIIKMVLDLDGRIKSRNKSRVVRVKKFLSKIGSNYPRLKTIIKLLAGRY